MRAVRHPKPQHSFSSQRRLLLKGMACAPLAALPDLAFATQGGRELRFAHTHTGETLRVSYWENGAYLPDALAEINLLMRDFRTEEVVTIEPALLDFVHLIQTTADRSGAFEIISAYRSPKTNELLRQSSNGVAKKSFHMKGQALDIRLPGLSTASMRDIAIGLAVGGVGYYANSDFLHVDVGPVRRW